jgi:hypothetical protein
MIEGPAEAAAATAIPAWQSGALRAMTSAFRRPRMHHDGILDILAWIGTACWGICFWWMHRISERQDTLLKALADQNERIERLSREEHKLIKEVHPVVSEIKESVQEVANTVANS